MYGGPMNEIKTVLDVGGFFEHMPMRAKREVHRLSGFQKQINEVNKILKHYSGIYKFIYIDNYAIKEVHLWKDNIHLNTDGIYKLANNYICHLNRRMVYPQF